MEFLDEKQRYIEIANRAADSLEQALTHLPPDWAAEVINRIKVLTETNGEALLTKTVGQASWGNSAYGDCVASDEAFKAPPVRITLHGHRQGINPFLRKLISQHREGLTFSSICRLALGNFATKSTNPTHLIKTTLQNLVRQGVIKNVKTKFGTINYRPVIVPVKAKGAK